MNIEFKQFEVFENKTMTTYGYSIKRDSNGDEISRTSPIKLGAIGWANGRTFTQEDYANIKNGVPTTTEEKTTFEKFISFIFGG